MATLKISDLSVGDWVMVNEKPRKISVLANVWNGSNQVLVGYVAHVYSNGYNGVFYKPIEKVKPIPITAEMLDANGWQRNEEDEYMEYYGDPTSGISHTKGTHRYRLETPEVSVVCYFVHQLQHALRLAGLDKEITYKLSVMATDYTKCSIGFALGNAFDNLATTVSLFGNLLDSILRRRSLKRVRLPQRRTIGKEHRGYARRSRQRLVQRKG